MSKPNRKIYVVGYAANYMCWMQGTRVYKMRDADLVVFTGGEDVDPSVYRQESHPTTSSNLFRDKEEVAEYKLAKSMRKPMIGICRGAQLLCAMNGGKLIQHQRNPYFLHRLYTFDNKENIITTSLHHQAAYPFLMPKDKYKILAWTNTVSPVHYGIDWDEDLKPPVECEIVYYPKTRCLGIQGHPEIMFAEHDKRFNESIEYFRDLLNQLLENKL